METWEFIRWPPNHRKWKFSPVLQRQYLLIIFSYLFSPLYILPSHFPFFGYLPSLLIFIKILPFSASPKDISQYTPPPWKVNNYSTNSTVKAHTKNRRQEARHLQSTSVSWHPWRPHHRRPAWGTPPGVGLAAAALTESGRRSSCWWKRRPRGRSPPPGNLNRKARLNRNVRI